MAGRKSKYDDCIKPHLEDINKKVREGVIESEIAKSLGISVATLNRYKQQYPDLKEALSKDKGIDALQRLVNAGIDAGCGGYKKEKVTIFGRDEDGNVVVKQITETERYYPPNPVLNKYYVDIYGKEQGFMSNPKEYELKKAKQEFEEELSKAKNWDVPIKF